MTMIDVTASRRYTVTIGSGILGAVGQHTHRLTKAERVCIVSDSNAWPLYGGLVKESLENEGFSVCDFVFAAGESSKNGQTYLALLNCLAENGLSRSDCIVALGGGVVGDLAGFAAATYLRGIPYLQIPTTLLAMVDSSVGGKTAIDLPVGKNLCGAFYQPVAVLCDTDTLATLPEAVFRDGCAEVIKYGILFDEDLFAALEKDGLNFDRDMVIARCVELKRDLVARDEFDTGARKLLNLGHTIGHPIEKSTHYEISHGCAVAMGMAVVCRAAHCPDTDRITSLLEAFGLPTATALTAEGLFACALSDKKRDGQQIDLIIPEAIGCCAIVPTAIETLKSFIEEGL